MTDDISAVVAYNSRIGVMWSNQNNSTMYFVFHVDGAADSAWTQNPALQGPNYADDTPNLKYLTAERVARVFAAVKTGFNDVDPPISSQPLILLLILDGPGSWQRKTFGRVSDNTPGRWCSSTTRTASSTCSRSLPARSQRRTAVPRSGNAASSTQAFVATW